MKKLQVLGPGCPKCEELAKRTEEAAKALGVDYELEKIKDLNQMMALGVFMTPALVVDGQVKSLGKVPSQEELKQMIS
jgi:small redox-active disulfide protein 2